MNLFSRRTIIAGAAPFAALAIFGGSVAFAQAGGSDTSSTDIKAQQADPTPTTPASPTNPTPPGTPKGDHSSANCPNMGGSGTGMPGAGHGTSGATDTQTGLTFRARH
jgi:hypothetical protein